MSCEICGRNNCTYSFHSLEAQREHDNIADEIKNRAIEIISRAINNLEGEHIDDDYYIKLEDVINIVEGYN